jgi:hypothetical protein
MYLHTTVVRGIEFLLCAVRILTDGDAAKENDINRRPIVNPYNRNAPHKNLPCKTPFLDVRNPYKKPSSQQRMESNHLPTMTHNSRVSKHAFLLHDSTIEISISP